ncbi:T9SS type A sorting domain-containing protein [bacterium]|nr:T9SS type A sorting domain-containing protein [bacterium]
MYRLICAQIAVILLSHCAYAASFVPTQLKISAPGNIQYNFDGSTLTIPLNVSGTTATTLFCVFTKDKASSIRNIRNGYLGWHYVNKIDTCIYMSALTNLATGTNVLYWNGKDNDGNIVPPGEYTYYIWGYDSFSAKTLLTKQITPNPWNRITLETHDEQGSPLVHPVIWAGSGDRGGGSASNTALREHSNKKWIVGYDPYDATLLETCASWEVCDPGGLAWHPDDHREFFKCSLNNNGNKVLYAWKWIPNGQAEKQMDWGEDGEYIFAVPNLAGWEYGPGVVSNGGDYLLVTQGDMSGNTTKPELIYVDVDTGAEVKRYDLSSWWVNMGDAEAGAQANNGPALISMWGDAAALGSLASCVNMLFDVLYISENEAVLWVNQNGDYIGDHNFEIDSPKPWVCNDYNVGPYKYNFVFDNNGFSFFPCYDLGAVSFGMFAPDGTGVGYLALAGETTGQKYDTAVISYESPYDGLLVTNQSAENTDERTGWFWVGEDSFKGVISADVWANEEVKIYPEKNPVISGQQVVVPVVIDMTGSSYSLGEYSIALSWSAASLRYIRTNGGSTTGWSDPLLNETNTGQGILKSSNIYSQGSTGKVNVFNVVLDVIGNANTTGVIHLDVLSLSAARTYTDLIPLTSTDNYDYIVTGQTSILVGLPNGGETLVAGSQYAITWTSQNVDRVKIEYSQNGGSTWSVVTASVSASNKSYTWTVPDITSSNCRIRISSTADAAIYDVSDQSFSIVPSGIWGEVNGNGTVNSADGLIIGSYGIDIPVGSYENNVLNYGDVNADGKPDLADGLICARYGIQPDYPSLPARVGQQRSAVAKLVLTPPIFSRATAFPHIQVHPGEADDIILTVSIESGESRVLIGAASVVVRWNSDAYRYAGITGPPENALINDRSVSSGELRMLRMEPAGLETVSFPGMRMRPVSDKGDFPISVEVLEAVEAETFAKMTPSIEAINPFDTNTIVFPVPVKLHQNVPNPFNPATSISYAIEKPSNILLTVYNINGQKVKTLISSNEQPGLHTVTWDGTDESGYRVSSGVYIYRLLTSAGKEEKQMLLLR